MSERYPHKLVYTAKASADVFDQVTGTWIPGKPGLNITLSCRAKPNVVGRKKSNKDGVQTEYSYDLGFPYDPSFDIPANAQVRIVGLNGNLILEGELMGYQVGTRSIIGWI